MNSSIKELAIKEYFSKINFNNDNWSLYAIKNDLKKILGEEPGVDITYKKDILLNEILGTSKEISKIDRVMIVFTDTNDTFKKLEFLID